MLVAAETSKTNARLSLALTLVIALQIAGSRLAHCEQLGSRDAANSIDEPREYVGVAGQQAAAQLLARHNSRLLNVPHSLARFLSASSRQMSGSSPQPILPLAEGRAHAEPSAQLTASSGPGYKRSSSALDALTGVTLGKRSANPLEFINLEPVLGRQAFMRSTPGRLFDMRSWPSASQLGYDSSSSTYDAGSYSSGSPTLLDY